MRAQVTDDMWLTGWKAAEEWMDPSAIWQPIECWRLEEIRWFGRAQNSQTWPSVSKDVEHGAQKRGSKSGPHRLGGSMRELSVVITKVRM